MFFFCNYYHHFVPSDFEQLDDAIRNGDIIPYQLYRGCLRMDGQTLINLEIFSNTADGSSSGKCIPY